MGLGSCRLREGREEALLNLRLGNAQFRLCSTYLSSDVCCGLAGVVGLGDAAGGGDENSESVSA